MKRPEKHLERTVLAAVGRFPDLVIGVNTTDVLYRHAALGALCVALRPFGDAAVRAAVDVLARNRQMVGSPGSPDLLGSYRGLAFAWELKTEEGRVSDLQEKWHASARRRGLHVEVIRSPGEALESLVRVAAGDDLSGERTR
jgi:hypothetical protein